MSRLNFTVAADKCISCNSCVRDCPSRIIRNVQGGIPHIEPESEMN
ncbi:MAG: 4Fe-4S binding protein, partial [Victivallaceae bacterium]